MTDLLRSLLYESTNVGQPASPERAAQLIVGAFMQSLPEKDQAAAREAIEEWGMAYASFAASVEAESIGEYL